MNAIKSCGVAFLLALAFFAACSVFAQDDAKARKLFQEAEAFAKNKENAKAIAKIEEAIKLTPKNDEYLRFAAQLYYFTQKFEDAFRYAQRADKAKPGDQWNQLLVASTAFYIHDFALAKEYCQKLTDGKAKFDKQNQDF